jgi:hypothetical protein
MRLIALVFIKFLCLRNMLYVCSIVTMLILAGLLAPIPGRLNLRVVVFTWVHHLPLDVDKKVL